MATIVEAPPASAAVPSGRPPVPGAASNAEPDAEVALGHQRADENADQAAGFEEVVIGEFVDEIPAHRPLLLTEGAAASGQERDAGRPAGPGLLGQLGAIVQAALATPFAHRTLERLGSQPLVERALAAAANAAQQAAPAYALAAKMLPPAASMARSAVGAVVSGQAARELINVALDAGEAARRIAIRPETDSLEVDAYGGDPSLSSRLEPLFDFLHERYFRIDVLGASRVPRGACILVCNHSGALPVDGPMIRTVLRRECGRPDARWLIEDALFHAPFMGVALNRVGAVRACPENAERLLAEGQAVVVFPEGLLGISKSVGRRYQLQRFGRGGFVKLAMRAGVPIVPVAIVGAEESSPLLGRIPARPLGVPFVPVTPTFPLLGLLGLVPLPSKWTVSFLPPPEVSQHGPKGALDHALVSRCTAEVRDAIQQELNRLLSERRERRTA